MMLKMGNSASASVLKTTSGSVSDAPSRGESSRLEALIETELPEELRVSARGLLRAVSGKVAVPGHFDAFCCQAFSKPEWAAVSSQLIAEMFEDDEDQLAEMARIPDLIIEMGSGEVNVTCMVASRWAARGETHRLSRLADAVVASHASRNACAVEVMLALAATLAVTRFSRAEQLYNAALPLAGEEHQEALMDARRWLAAGRVVCSAVQEERDFWDLRLRKPKVVWTWQSKAEREALDHLSDCLTSDTESADLYRAVLPENWWDMAIKCALQQEKLAIATKKLAAVKMDMAVFPKPTSDQASVPERVSREIPPHPQAGPLARFALFWLCGCIATLFTLLLVPRDYVIHVLDALKPVDVRAGLQAWRSETLQKKLAELKPYKSQYELAKSGGWQETETVLSGQSQELPLASPQYLNLLVCLHLDPPQNEEVRMHVCKLLLDRVKGDAISLWEMLIYPGSANAAEIKRTALSALKDKAYQWTDEEKNRLSMLAIGKMGAIIVPGAEGKH
jgi:hypothetical protein